MTADGFPVGIGDIVFIIWNEMRRNKCGRYYASRNLVVYPVNITSLTFERDYKEGDIYWTGDCVTLTDLDGVQASFGCRMGKYNAFSTEEAAKDSMKSGYWDSGILTENKDIPTDKDTFLAGPDNNGATEFTFNYADTKLTYTNGKIEYAATKLTDANGSKTYTWTLGQENS